MRLGVVFPPIPNAMYRAIEPMRAMERRGHQVMWPQNGKGDLKRLKSCDVVHIYRDYTENARRGIAELVGGGTAVTYDNDDDFTAVPEESPSFKRDGGAAGRRFFMESVKVAKLVRSVTTTNEVLAEKYRSEGIRRVEVIDNHLGVGVDRPRTAHEGLVIGWVAALEHLADAARIPIVDALQRVQAKHPDVHVECIGVDLRLPERYRHDAVVPFENLPARIGGFDIAIAPLADIPYNHSRSDIKLKEYAASGVPWLASPVGPYQGHGEAEGGWLVPDDGWFDALDRLVSKRWTRWRLSRKARSWAARSTTEAVADRWEDFFMAASGKARTAA